MGKLRDIYSFLPLKGFVGSFISRRFIDNPVFVVCCGRSGTTALCLSMDQHPEILIGKPEAPLHHHVGEYQNKVKSKSPTFLRQHFPCAGPGRFLKSFNEPVSAITAADFQSSA